MVNRTEPVENNASINLTPPVVQLNPTTSIKRRKQEPNLKRKDNLESRKIQGQGEVAASDLNPVLIFKQLRQILNFSQMGLDFYLHLLLLLLSLLIFFI